jgi:hypothetical protein
MIKHHNYPFHSRQIHAFGATLAHRISPLDRLNVTFQLAVAAVNALAFVVTGAPHNFVLALAFPWVGYLIWRFPVRRDWYWAFPG